MDIDMSLRGINAEFAVFVPQSLVWSSAVLGWILIYRNWSVVFNEDVILLFTTTEVSLMSIFC